MASYLLISALEFLLNLCCGLLVGYKEISFLSKLLVRRPSIVLAEQATSHTQMIHL